SPTRDSLCSAGKLMDYATYVVCLASQAITNTNAAVSCSGSSASPLANRRMTVSSACGELAVGVADTERVDEAFGEPSVRRDQRDDQAEQAHPVYVVLVEDAVLRAIGQIQHAHEVTVVDQWKADERARGEILVAQQRMSLRLTD